MNNASRIFSSFFLSEFGRGIYFVSIAWALYKMTNDAFFSGLMVGLGFIPGLIFNLFFGVIIDKFNRKKLAIFANLSSSIATLLLLIFTVLGSLNPLIIIIIHMLLQLTGSLFRPSIQAFMSEIFNDEELPNVFSKSSSMGILGGVLGSALGGVILSMLALGGSIVLTVLAFLISAVNLNNIKSKNNSELKAGKSNLILDFFEGLKYVKNNKILIALFIMMFNGQLAFHTSVGFLSVYTINHLRESSSIYGVLDAVIALGGVLAGFLGGWFWKKFTNRIAYVSLLILTIGLLIVGISNQIFISVIGLVLIGLGSTWVRSLLQAVQQIVTEKQFQGRMASFRMLCNQGSVVIGGPILGIIANNLGSQYVYLSLVLPIGLCFIFSVFQSKYTQFIEITNQ